TQVNVPSTSYIPRLRELAKCVGPAIATPEAVRAAYDHGEVELQAKVVCRIDGVRKETTVGRVLLSDIVPKKVGFDAINKVLGKKELGALIDTCYRLTGEKETVLLADRIRSLGDTNATR